MVGVPFANIATDETRELIAEMIASGQPHYAATANVDFVVQALGDVELRRILAEAHLVLCDGMPLVWASRFLGNSLPERVPGSGLVPMLLEDAEKHGWRVFFLGGSEASIAKAAANTRAKHPNLKLVGAYSPPFKPLLEMDHQEILERIRAARPDLLLVAFGCPKQEKWIHMHYREAGVPVCMGVGATIDFLAETFKRAPLWMQQTGTEWIFRMLQEPRRLARRYGKDLVVFGRAILAQWWQTRSRRRAASPVPEEAREVPTAQAAVFRAPARLDATAAERSVPVWDQALEHRSLILDLSATTFADSTGIGGLVRLRKRARELGRSLALAAPGSQLKRALELMRLRELFLIADDLTAAEALVAARRDVPTVALAPDPTRSVLRWAGEVTAATALEVESQSLTALETAREGTEVKVDLSGTSFIDSTGIGLMIRLKKMARQRQVRLTYAAPSATVMDVLRTTKLTECLLNERV